LKKLPQIKDIFVFGHIMLANQPDSILEEISSYLKPIDVQRLTMLSKGMNSRFSANRIWSSLLGGECGEMAPHFTTNAKKLLLLLMGVVLPANEMRYPIDDVSKLEFFYVMKYMDKVIRSGGPCTISADNDLSRGGCYRLEGGDVDLN